MVSKKIMMLIGLVVLLGAGMVIYGVFGLQNRATSEPHNNLTSVAQAPTGGDFTLNSVAGNVSLSDFKGKKVFLYFGYTFCPDICPTNLGNLALAHQDLTAKEKANIQIIFVSVDPERDTVERLSKYVSYFGMNAIGLTGKAKDLASIARRYGAVYVLNNEKADDPYYTVDHSAFTYVISPKGKLLKQLPHATTPDIFVTEMRAK